MITVGVIVWAIFTAHPWVALLLLVSLLARAAE